MGGSRYTQNRLIRGRQSAVEISMSNSFLNPVTTQTWANGRHIVRCVKVIQETWDVRTFCFMADQPILFFFKPGQFVTLQLEIEGQPIMRSRSEERLVGKECRSTCKSVWS